MNTYLKIDNELPLGLDYLNLNDISLPKTIVSAGSLISGFNFTGGYIDDVVNEKSSVIGYPENKENGIILGPNGYIDTGLNELESFTLIAVLKPISIANDLAVTTFTNEAITGNEKASGIGMAPTRFHARQQGGSFAALDFHLKPRINEYAIIALSRESASLTLHSRVAGESVGSRGTCTTDVQNMTTFGIGYTINAKPLNATGRTIYCYTAIHSKSMTDSELKKYVDDLAIELNTLNSKFNL